MIVYRMEKNDRGVFYNPDRVLVDDYPDDALFTNYGCTMYWHKGDSNFRFACGSLEQLVEYFGSEFANLLSRGALPVGYEVPDDYVEWGEDNVELCFPIAKASKKFIYVLT